MLRSVNRLLAEKPLLQKLVRYSMASVVGVVLGQSLLLAFYAGLDWDAVPSNILAVVLSTIPVYVINRSWVWSKSGSNSFLREVLPFWTMALAGLALSTLLVNIANQHSDAAIVISLANLAGFGMLWVGKFLVLEHLLFREADAEADAAAAQAATATPDA